LFNRIINRFHSFILSIGHLLQFFVNSISQFILVTLHFRDDHNDNDDAGGGSDDGANNNNNNNNNNNKRKY